MTTTEYINLVNTLEEILEKYKQKYNDIKYIDNKAQAYWEGAIMALEVAITEVKGEV